MRGVQSVLDITCNLKEVVVVGHLRQGRSLGRFAGRLWSPFMQGPTTVRGRDLKLPAGLRCVNRSNTLQPWRMMGCFE
jgi:hypothetical protein